MTICPVAVIASCEKCPIVGVCPGKSIIGDYEKDVDAKKDSQEEKS